MLIRQQRLHRIKVIAGEQIRRSVLFAGAQIERKAAVPNRCARSLSADTVRPDNEHRALDRCAVAAFERLIFGGDRRALKEERPDGVVDAALHLGVGHAGDLRKIDIPAVLAAVRLIAHKLLIVDGVRGNAAAEVEFFRLLEQRAVRGEVYILHRAVLCDTHHVFRQNGGILGIFERCGEAAVLAEEDQRTVCGVVPRKAEAQLGEAADITQRAVGQAAAGIHRRDRTVLAAGGIQSLTHVGEIVIRRCGEQLARGIHDAPAIDLAHHRLAAAELGDGIVQKIRQQSALGERIERLIGAVGDDHRALAVDRHVGRCQVARQRVQHRAGGVDGLIIAILRADERAPAGERTGIAVYAVKGRRAALRDERIQAGVGVLAQQQAIFEKADCTRIAADTLAGRRVVYAVVGVAVRDHVVGKIDRNRRIRVIDDEMARPVDDSSLPFVVFNGGESAVREIARLRVGKREYSHAVLIQIACAGHAVDVGAFRRKDRAGRRRTHQHHARHRQRG